MQKSSHEVSEPKSQGKKNVDLKTVKSKCPYDDNYTINTFYPDTAAFLNNSEQTAHLRTESKETYPMYYLYLSFNLLYHYQGIGLLFLAKLLSLPSSCFLAYITSTFNCLEFRVLAIVCIVSPSSFVRIRNSCITKKRYCSCHIANNPKKSIVYKW